MHSSVTRVLIWKGETWDPVPAPVNISVLYVSVHQSMD